MIGYGSTFDDGPVWSHSLKNTDEVKPLKDKNASSFGVIVSKLTHKYCISTSKDC